MSERALSDKEQDRYASTRVKGILALPKGSRDIFWVAAAIGAFVDEKGRREWLPARDSGIGTVITNRHRDLVCEVMGIGQRRWRQAVSGWKAANMAHRCRRGVLFLYSKPSGYCPRCLARSGSGSAAETAVRVPQSGSEAAVSRRGSHDAPKGMNSDAGAPVGALVQPERVVEDLDELLELNAAALAEEQRRQGRSLP